VQVKPKPKPKPMPKEKEEPIELVDLNEEDDF
jgi:hypothetical protein